MIFEKFFMAFCSSLDKKDISFLILRNYDLLPSSFGNDIDLLVRPSQVRETREILIKVASINHFSLTKERVRFNFHSFEMRSSTDPHCFIKMDIFTGLSKGWFSYMCVDQMLEKKINRECFYTPNLEMEIYCLILKEMYMYGFVRYKYQGYFKKMLPKIDLNIFESLLGKYVTKKSEKFILDNLNNLYSVKHYPCPKLIFFFDYKNIFRWFYLNFQDGVNFRWRLCK